MEFLLSLSFLGIISASCTILSKNPVHSVFFLILTFCISASLLLTIVIDFLAIIFIVVYVGAIAVLFLFVVMMLNTKFIEFSESITRYLPFSILLLFILYNELLTILNMNIIFFTKKITIWVNYLLNADFIIILSEVLYTEYVHIFIIAGILLLLAMIGTINITLYHALNVKRQFVYKQIGRTIINSIALKY